MMCNGRVIKRVAWSLSLALVGRRVPIYNRLQRPSRCGWASVAALEIGRASMTTHLLILLALPSVFAYSPLSAEAQAPDTDLARKDEHADAVARPLSAPVYGEAHATGEQQQQQHLAVTPSSLLAAIPGWNAESKQASRREADDEDTTYVMSGSTLVVLIAIAVVSGLAIGSSGAYILLVMRLRGASKRQRADASGVELPDGDTPLVAADRLQRVRLAYPGWHAQGCSSP